MGYIGLGKKWKRQPFSREWLQEVAFDLRLSEDLFSRLQAKATELLQATEIITGWLGFIIYWKVSPLRTAWDSSVFQRGATLRLVPIYPWQSGTMLVIVLAAYSGAYFIPSQQGYARAFLLIPILDTLLLNLIYLIGLQSLPSQLRQARGNPYFNVLLLAFLELCTLVLAINGLTNWSQGRIASLQDIQVTLEEFLSLKAIWGDHKSWPIRLLAGSAVSLYGLTLGKSIKNYRELKRTDEDHLALAQTYVFTGDFEKALVHVDKLKSLGRDAHLSKALAYLGLGEIEKALASAAIALQAGGTTPTPDRAFPFLAAYANWIPFPEKVYLSLLSKGMALQVADTSLLDAIGFVAGPPAELRLDSIFGLFSDEATRSRFSLSYARILTDLSREDEALQILSAMETRLNVDKIIQLCLFIGINIRKCGKLEADAQECARKCFDEWCKRNLSELHSLVGKLSDDRERLIVVWYLYIPRNIGIDLYSVDCTSLIEEVKNTMSGDDLFYEKSLNLFEEQKKREKENAY